jgi:hypothetical protein
MQEHSASLNSVPCAHLGFPCVTPPFPHSLTPWYYYYICSIYIILIYIIRIYRYYVRGTFYYVVLILLL